MGKLPAEVRNLSSGRLLGKELFISCSRTYAFRSTVYRLFFCTNFFEVSNVCCCIYICISVYSLCQSAQMALACSFSFGALDESGKYEVVKTYLVG